MRYQFTTAITVKHVFIQFPDLITDEDSFTTIKDMRITISGAGFTKTWQQGEGENDSFGSGFYDVDISMAAGQDLTIMFVNLDGASGYKDLVVSAINFFGKEKTAVETSNI